MKKLKRYVFCGLGYIFFFGTMIPYLIAWSIDTKDLDFWLRLAVIALAPLPFAIVSASLGMVLIELANDKYPSAPSTKWINFKRSAERAGQHLGRTLAFLMMTAFALIILRATGWWDLFDPSKSVSDWPWYNFVALLLGGGFAGNLIYHAVKHLGDRD
jgi:hypothetical protein